MHPDSRIPVLTVQEAQLRNLDPQDPKDLSLMWSTFARVSPLVENAERLQNLSWRLWNRETLCSPPRSPPSCPIPISRPNATSQHQTTLPVPELSKSVESYDSFGSSSCEKSAAHSQPHEQRQKSRRQSSNNHTRERHITPSDLENLVHSIREKADLEPLQQPFMPSPPLQSQPCQITEIPTPSSPHPVNTESSTSTVATVATAITDSFNSPDTKSDTSVASSEGSSHCVVRGFTPGTGGVTSYTSKTQLAPAEPRPILKTSGTSIASGAQKKKGMFLLGCSSGEEDHSLSRHMSPRSNPIYSADSQRNGQIKKQTSFKDEVLVMRDPRTRSKHSAAVVDSDDESDDCESDIEEVSESAIDDDDEDEWEDDTEDTQPEEKEIKFYRVDSKANLVSRKSALTLNLEEQRSGGKLQNSRSTPALQRARTSPMNGPSMPASPEDESVLEMKRRQMPSSKPLVVNQSKPNGSVAPLPSPGTLRRNMFCGELSESLRKNMLTERLQKNPLGSSSAQMKRAHTSFDVTKLAQVPENGEQTALKDCSNLGQGRKPSWNHYFDHSVGEYHQTGW